MKIRILLLAASLSILACKEQSKEPAKKLITENTEIETEKISEWITLFDGTSLDKWQAYLGGEVPKFWSIEGEDLVFTPPTTEERKNAGPKDYNLLNLISKDEYTNFVLSLDWKISEGGNSGIFWGIYENEKYGAPHETGLEVQILDNDKHPDGKEGTTHQAGALYDLVGPAKDVTKPVGEWNTVVITVNHNTNSGSCVLNGVEIASFPVGGEELKNMLKDSKFNGWEDFAEHKTGKIGLQDHADLVSFRNIKIKEL